MSIAHIAVYTEDIERSKEFYSLFGGKETGRITLGAGNEGRTLVHLDIDGVVMELVCFNDKAKMKNTEGVVGHFCICVDNIEEIGAELKKNGFDSFIDEEPVVINILGIYRKRFLKGPSGEIIELIEKK